MTIDSALDASRCGGQKICARRLIEAADIDIVPADFTCPIVADEGLPLS